MGDSEDSAPPDYENYDAKTKPSGDAENVSLSEVSEECEKLWQATCISHLYGKWIVSIPSLNSSWKLLFFWQLKCSAETRFFILINL